MNKDLWEKINYLKQQEQVLKDARGGIPTLTDPVQPAVDAVAVAAALERAVEDVLAEARDSLERRIREVLVAHGLDVPAPPPLPHDDADTV